MAAVSLIAPVAIVLSVALAACGSPHASASARVERVLANVRGIT